MPTPVPLDPAALPLDRHAILEASAGTGKTYTITQLVLRLLREYGIPLERILILTYTEKATAELESRIRHAITEAAANAGDDPAAEPCREALSRFEEASIHTIHGFCRQTLARYALETGCILDPELVDDHTAFSHALTEVLRGEAPEVFGSLFPLLVEGTDSLSASWQSRVLHAARHARPAFGDRLHPDPEPLLRFCVTREEGDPLAHLWDSVRLALGSGWETPASHPLRALYAEAPINKTYKEPALEVLDQILAYAATPPTPAQTLRWIFALARHTKAFYQRLREHGFAALSTEQKWNKCPEAVRDALCDPFAPLVEALAPLHPLLTLDPVALFSAWVANRTREHATRRKRERGHISFDDMLLQVAEGLRREEGLLREALRAQYRVALVDEFQDTDILQWEILRTVFDAPGHRLILIGDPKQAIYRFRGADLGTYLAARKTLLQRNASYVMLDTNWRSTPDLIQALNELFTDTSKTPWFPPDTEIRYEPVRAAPPDKLPCRLVQDQSGRAAMTQVHLQPPPPAPDSQTDFAEAEALQPWQAGRIWGTFLAREIRMLLGLDGGGARMILETGTGDTSTRRPLRADDIAILVQRRADSRPLEAALRAADVPFTFYKKPGVFESTESLHLLAVLDAVADPADSGARAQALLTDFFRRSVDEVDAADGVPPGHALGGVWERLEAAAAHLAWTRFFQILLEETGVLLAPPADPQRDPERRNENYRHLSESLEAHARATRASIQDLARHLRQLRTGTITLPENASLHRQETEVPKVQILTMHASKGLQFPVVFFGGARKTVRLPLNAMPILEEVDEEGRRVRVFDCAKGDVAKASEMAQQEEELRRLLYVALTRARFKLYLPDDGTRNGKTADAEHDILYPALDAMRESAVFHRVHAADACPQHPGISLTVTEECPAPSAEALRLVPLPPLRHRVARITSFSSMDKAYRPPTTLEVDTPEATRRIYRMVGENGPAETPVPASPDPAEGRAVTPRHPHLPKGKDFGNLVHDLLETLDWSLAPDPDAWNRQVTGPIREACRQYGLSPSGDTAPESMTASIAGLLRDTLCTPLPVEGMEPIPLHLLPPAARRHEVEFFFPLPGIDGDPDASPLPPGFRHGGDGWVHGLIDLVFDPGNGRYALLDWKTNTLEGYGAEDLREAMREKAYRLQAELYAIALRRWIRSRGLPEDACGGVYYLFLRGLDPEVKPGRSPGIHYVPVLPSEEACLETLRITWRRLRSGFTGS